MIPSNGFSSSRIRTIPAETESALTSKTAITVALLARTNPLGVIPAALLIGAMQAGASRMQFDSGVSPEIIDVVQALILFFVAADVIIRGLLRIRATDAERVTLSSGWGQG